MKGSTGLPLAIVVLFALGCAAGTQNVAPTASTPATKSIQPVINIPELAGKGAAFVDARLGAAGEITPTDDPGTTPGEFRDYTVPGVAPRLTSHGLMVRFYRDRAVHFTFELPRPVETPEEALLMAGIDVHGTDPHTNATLAKLWSGTFSGVAFKTVSAQRLDATYTRYTTIQVEVYK